VQETIAPAGGNRFYSPLVLNIAKAENVSMAVLETISGMYKMSLRKEISNSLFNSLFMQVAREDIKLIPSQDLISNIDRL
jgi:hypothetical protein